MKPMAPEEILVRALQQHQAGHLQQAAGIYLEIVCAFPGQAQAWHLLGVAANQSGRPDLALESIRRAIELNPHVAGFHNDLGLVFRALKDAHQAVSCYQRALEIEPEFAEAHHNLGNALKDLGRLEEAVQHYQCAVALKPDYALAHYHLGVVWQERGSLDESIACHRRAAELKPDFAEAHHALGNALKDQGKFDESIAAYRLALRCKEDSAATYNNLGTALQSLSRLEEASACFARALELKPDYTVAHNNLGTIFQEQGRPADALRCYESALAANPQFAQAFHNMGKLLKDQGKFDEALACYKRVLELQPETAEAHNNVGLTFALAGKLDEAIPHYRRALALNPDLVEALNNLAIALGEQKALDEGAACCLRAIQIKPDYAEAHYNLGNIRKEQEHWDEAIACYRRAVAIKPDFAEAHNNMGTVLKEEALRTLPPCEAKLAEAEACYETALKFKPSDAELHLNISLIRLLTGRWESAWPEYEWRWKTKEFTPRHFLQPMWRGESLHGKTIFLHAEQGFGDTIQFIRYAPLVKERGGRVVVLCQDALIRLLGRTPGADQWIASTGSVPDFDVHAPLLSLPGIFNTVPATMPANIPYIFAAPDLIADWRRRLAAVPGLKVGITWQGNPDHKRDRFRSIPLAAFEPLAQVKNLYLFSLQKGAGLEQLHAVADRFPIIDPGPLDFMDLAAAMMNLDLIISCDTAIAHLAGALGRPVWVALSYTPDWRWLLVCRDSSWYPTMRLFRQSIPGDWNSVFREMADEINRVSG